MHYVVIDLFACEQNMFANSVLTPSQQPPQLPCSLASFDLVIDGVSKILVHVFLLTCRFLFLLTCRFGSQLLRAVLSLLLMNLSHQNKWMVVGWHGSYVQYIHRFCMGL